MLTVPRQSQFTRRDDFAAAVSVSFEELARCYEAEPVLHAAPDWADAKASVTLPIEIANEGGAAHALATVMRHAIEQRKSAIGRLARVERDGLWTLFFEAK